MYLCSYYNLHGNALVREHTTRFTTKQNIENIMDDASTSPPQVGEEEVDEDEWYARMENAAMAHDPEVVQYETETNDKLYQNDNENDYFEQMDLAAKNGEREGMFVDEDSTIWQSMLRKIASDGSTNSNQYQQIKSTDELEILLCQQWLFSHLPNSLTIYHMVKSDYLANHPTRLVYVDHKVHPSMIFTCLYKANTKYLHCTIFTPVSLSKTAYQSVVDWLYIKARSFPECKSLYLASTDYVILENALIHDTRLRNLWTEECKMFICDPCAKEIIKLAASILPTGYSFCDLRFEDAEIINETWKYKSQDSIDMVRKMVLNSGVCKGIRHDEDGLIAWCLTYEDGPMGMLQTLPKHRNKGLGRCVVAALLQQILNNSMTETPPYCYIEQSNEASMKLFRSLGFYKTIDVVWSEFSFSQ